mgnify:CR=1 FL=1
MQGFRDLGPHLINVTMSDDRTPLYVLGFGAQFSDLTDDEKETAYFSQRYLAEKYEKEASQLRGELAKARPHRVRVLVRKIRKSK